MNNNLQDKDRLIEYLSVIRDAEVSKPSQEADMELIDACVGLLLHLQNKNADLTPEQINNAVSKIRFIDTNATEKTKSHKKKFNKKLLLIAAVIPILLTILTLVATADTEWSYFKVLKEFFGGVDKTPIGEIIHNNDDEIGKINRQSYKTPAEFAEDYDIEIMVPGNNFKKDKLQNIAYISYPTGDEVSFTFENGSLTYRICMYDCLAKETRGTHYITRNINGLNCYIIEFDDIGQYQVYFNYKGFTYCFTHSDLEVIINLIENMEELK